MLEQRILLVQEVTGYIKNLLENDLRLTNLWVRGEVSNFKQHTSGHLYFTLKDRGATLRCVMFRSSASKLLFQPDNGMEVVAGGYISVYEPSGQYQLYVKEMDASGMGSLYMAYQQLKDKLEQEGLFDSQKKRPLPRVPHTVAVVTSPTGAALRDVLNVINRRFPGVEVLMVPTLVQGRDAPSSISRSLEMTNRHGEADVILLVRGGGSLEELWAFNTETVARSVYKSSIPILTGIGHELDFTIADFVADQRAPTPSAAAELAVPVRGDLLKHLSKLKEMLSNSAKRYITDRENNIDKVSQSKVFINPALLLSTHWQTLDNLERQLKTNMNFSVQEAVQRLAIISGKMDALSPLGILARGYAICLKDSKIIRDSDEVEAGDDVEMILGKGSLGCRVIRKRGDLIWERK